jgi:hypothetical protein
MKTFILTLLVIFTLMTKAQSTYTWTGVVDSDYAVAGNWNPAAVPSASDNIVFAGSSNPCDFTPELIFLTNLTIYNTYTGIIDALTCAVTITGTYSQSGGTFICPTDAAFVIGGSIMLSGGTFNHNDGLVELSVATNGTVNVSGAISFFELDIVPNGLGPDQRNVNFGSGTSTEVLRLNGQSHPFSYQGKVSAENLYILGTNTGSLSNNSGTIEVNGLAPTIIGASSTGRNMLPNVIVNTPGDLAMTAHIAVSGTWTSIQTATLSAGTSSVVFFGSASAIVGGTTAATRAKFDHLTIASTSTLNLGSSTQIDIGRHFRKNGVLNTSNNLIRLTGTPTQSILGSGSITVTALEIANSGSKALMIPHIILDSVKINDGTLLSNGNLRLRSTATLKARIAEITGAGGITGNVTVETFAKGGTTDWANMGVSGISGRTVANWEGQIPMTCSLCPNSQTATGGHFVSIQAWNETAAAGSATAYVEQNYTSPLTVGKGFWVYLGNGQATTSDITYSVSGPAVTGIQSMSLTYSGPSNGDGYNLIANPYASPISWTKLRNSNPNVNNAIYVYNADIGATTSFVNGLSSHGPGIGCNDVIPMGQAFYVRAIAPTVLTALESNKVSHNTSTNPLLKSANSNPSVLRLRLNGFDSSLDETAIRFEHSASPSFDDEWDAFKIFSSPGYLGYPGAWNKRTTISSQMYGVDYSINSLPPAGNQDLNIPILARAYSTGQYTISPSGLESVPADLCISLTDKLTGTTKDLRTGPYVCNISDTTTAARFVLTVCGNNAAPVDLPKHQNAQSHINIHKDATGATIQLEFPQSTSATISVMNILGQKVMKDKTVNALKESVHLDLNSNNEILFVTVSTDKERVTKKIIH